MIPKTKIQSNQKSLKHKNRICLSYLSYLVKNQSKHRYYNLSFDSHNTRTIIIYRVLLKKCISCDFSFVTFFKSVALFDSIISRAHIPKALFAVFGHVCLKLVAKVNETQEKYMKLERNRNPRKSLDTLLAAKIERQILQMTEFDANPVTPFDFVLAFLENCAKNENKHDIILAIDKRVFYLLTRNIQLVLVDDYKLHQFTSISVGIVTIMLARELAGLRELIPSCIRHAIGYSQESLTQLHQYAKNQLKSTNIFVYSNKFVSRLVK